MAQRVFAWATGWSDQNAGDVEPRSYSRLIWILGIFTVVLIAVVGLTYDWQHGSGEGKLFVDVIATVGWNLYLFVQVALIAAIVVAVRQQFSSKSSGS